MIPLFRAHALTDIALVETVLRSGTLGEGPMVLRFQAALKSLFRHERVLPLSSCTGALALALRVCGAGPGCSVISTPFTMIATNAAIHAVGAEPVWCDVDPSTLCAEYESVARAVSPKTRVIVVTCVAGLVPARLEALCDLGVPVILDCAHALTSVYKGKHVSSWGNFACFSFQATKHLTTGDGGALAVNGCPSAARRPMTASAAFELAERLKWFGLSRANTSPDARLDHQMTSDVDEIGFKYQMNDIAAAVGLCTFDLAKAAVAASVSNAQYYQSVLAGNRFVRLLQVPLECSPSWWVYGFLHADAKGLIGFLRENGVCASQLWRRNDSYTGFARARSSSLLGGMNAIENEVVFIPSGWWVSPTDRERIAGLVWAYEMPCRARNGERKCDARGLDDGPLGAEEAPSQGRKEEVKV